MVQFMKVNLKITISTDMDILSGQMASSMKDFGSIIESMVKAILCGKMGEDLKENISMVKNRDLGSFIGLMEEFIEVNGKVASKMVEEFLYPSKEHKKQEFGVMVKR